MNRYGNIAGETAKFLLECNAKLGRQHRGLWQHSSQIDDQLETEFGLRVCLGQNKNTRNFNRVFLFLDRGLNKKWRNICHHQIKLGKLRQQKI